MGGGTHSSRLDDGAAFHILKLAVHKRVPDDKAIPGTLSTVTPLTVAGVASRRITLSTGRMMQWLTLCACLCR
jgi:hypothetical protein